MNFKLRFYNYFTTFSACICLCYILYLPIFKSKYKFNNILSCPQERNNILKKKQFYNQYVEKKIGRIFFLSNMMILIMFAIVLYDSYTHVLPFHYVLFAVAGVLAGRVYQITNKVHFNKEEVKIKIEIGISALVIMVITLFIRFFAGKWLLTSMEIVWLSDALYLFFIGVHIEKIIATRKNVDELLYNYIIKIRSDSKKNQIDSEK